VCEAADHEAAVAEIDRRECTGARLLERHTLQHGRLEDDQRLLTELARPHHHGGGAVADRHEELESVLGGREPDVRPDENAVNPFGEGGEVDHALTISCSTGACCRAGRRPSTVPRCASESSFRRSNGTFAGRSTGPWHGLRKRPDSSLSGSATIFSTAA